MAYINRDQNGKIISVVEDAQYLNQEFLNINSPELIDYITSKGNGSDARTALSVSDASLIRVLEDLVKTLIDKKAILFTDLPSAAREKLISRGKIRDHINDPDNLISLDEEEGLL